MLANLNLTFCLLSGKWATTVRNQKMTCVPSEDSDQPGHPPSLIRVFAVRMIEPWGLSYPLSAQRRQIGLCGCTGWSESSLGAYVVLLILSCCGSNILYLWPPSKIPSWICQSFVLIKVIWRLPFKLQCDCHLWHHLALSLYPQASETRNKLASSSISRIIAVDIKLRLKYMVLI